MAEMMARDSLGGSGDGWLGPGRSWGLGNFSIVMDPVKAGYVVSPGTLVWGGIFGTQYMVNTRRQFAFLSPTRLHLNEVHPFAPLLHICQIDPVEGVCAVLLTQRFPNKGNDLRGKLPQLVMQALL